MNYFSVRIIFVIIVYNALLQVPVVCSVTGMDRGLYLWTGQIIVMPQNQTMSRTRPQHQQALTFSWSGKLRWSTMILPFIFPLFFSAASDTDSLVVPDHLPADQSNSFPVPPAYWKERVHEAVPSGYLSQITGLDSPSRPAGNLKGIGWVNKEVHQVAEDPEGLSNTEKILTEIQRTGRIFTQLDGRTLLNIPFGIESQFGDIDYFIGFNNLRLYPEYASIDLVAAIYIPALGDTLIFSAANVKYNNRSGLLGDTRLYLVQDFLYEIHERKTAVIVRGWREESQTGTYLKVSCNGVEEINIGLEFLFNNDFIRPVNPGVDYVKAFTQLNYNPQNGLMVSDLSIAPFYFKDFKEVAFSLENVTVDLDEYRTDVPFIQNYLDQAGSLGMNAREWTGFYCRHFKLIIGTGYLTQNKSEPLIVEGDHVFIDELGLTAQLILQKTICKLDETRIAGWPISIDAVQLDIFTNQLRGFGFSGLIHVPVLEQKRESIPIPEVGDELETDRVDAGACLHYSARFIPDSAGLELTVEAMDTHEFSIPIFFGNIQIKEGSYLKLTAGDVLKIAANLNGAISINADLGGSSGDHTSLQTPEILFEGLFVSNHAPYLMVQSIRKGAGDSSHLGKFPLTFDEIKLYDHEPEKYQGQLKKLHFENLQLELGSITDGDALSVSSSLNIYFGVTSFQGRQRWSGKDLEIDKFHFAGTLPGVEYIEGQLAFRRADPTYGTGFVGGGLARFGFLDATVSMMCMFGSTGDAGFKYSYVDAALDFERPVGDQAFRVYLLIAGYHQNMARQELTRFETGDNTAEELLSIEPGGHFPDNKWIPTLKSRGIRGGLIARAGEGAIMGLRVLHEWNQSEGQGVTSRFKLEGLIELMPRGDDAVSPATRRLVNEEETPTITAEVAPEDFAGSGALGGYIRIELIRNQQGHTFNAALGIHGTAGGITIGFYGEYYRDPDAWHLFVGKPDNRLQLGYSLTGSDIVQASIAIHGYFMMGNSDYLPRSLPEPYSISGANATNLRIAYDSLVHNPATNIYNANQADLARGKALALGAGLGLAIRIAVPERQEWLLVEAGADIGFDLLLTKSTPECNLQSLSETGINGWYFYGQMYAGVVAKVGIKIKNRALKIFEGGACVLIQGAGFEPTWGVGTWRFNYQVLFIRGEAQGIFKFGQPCTEINASFNPDRILENIYPGRPVTALEEETSENLISMNSDFRMDFVLPADRKISQTLTDFQTGATESFNIRLVSEIDLKNQNGNMVTGEILYDNLGMTLIFRPQEMLVPGDILSLRVKSTIYDDRGIYSINGKMFTVDTTVHYRVDPNGIMGLRTDDIAVSYPVVNQQYFHKDEFDRMMVSFGKTLPLQNVTLTSHLLREVEGHFLEVETGILEIEETRLVQPVFKKLGNAGRYQWVIRADSGIRDPVEIVLISFSTSRYGTFDDKSRNIRIADFSLNTLEKMDSVLPLQIITDEPLEFHDGNILTRLIAKNDDKESADLKSNGQEPGKIAGLDVESAVTGEQYLTRFLSTFSRHPRYSWLGEVYHHHVPYGTLVRIKCSVDDTPEARQSADPADAYQSYHMDPWVDQILVAKSGEIQYDILRNIHADWQYFRQLKPAVPPYYADCIDYDRGPVPYYKPGSYPVKLRYFIPGFEQYSSSNAILDFNLVH